MSQADASPRRKGRPWLRGLAVVLVVILAVLAAAYAFRKDIAAEAARMYLDGQDIAVRSLDVTVLGPDRVELRNVTLGSAEQLSV